jgi:hypothetical protein
MADTMNIPSGAARSNWPYLAGEDVLASIEHDPPGPVPLVAVTTHRLLIDRERGPLTSVPYRRVLAVHWWPEGELPPSADQTAAACVTVTILGSNLENAMVAEYVHLAGSDRETYRALHHIMVERVAAELAR